MLHCSRESHFQVGRADWVEFQKFKSRLSHFRPILEILLQHPPSPILTCRAFGLRISHPCLVAFKPNPSGFGAPHSAHKVRAFCGNPILTDICHKNHKHFSKLGVCFLEVLSWGEFWKRCHAKFTQRTKYTFYHMTFSLFWKHGFFETSAVGNLSKRFRAPCACQTK